MCGIAGAVSFDKNLSSKNTSFVKSMSKSMLHRGPDAGGFFSDNNVALSHRRLSIIDLDESSNQPMQSSDEQIIIVFNGEIYNHEYLRKKLERKHTFQTKNSDTEVIINAYKEWGINCVDQFVGMFAFAIYDVDNKKVFLARDRLGKKPLYYTVENNTLYFSSENQAFFDSKLKEKIFNEESIYHYLTYLTTPAPNTFYKGIYKLEAGYYCEISTKHKLEKTQYWNISDFINKENSTSSNEAYISTNKLLEDSMYHRNVADVPISIALSGGLDSSLNLFYTKKIRTDRVSTINIKFDTSTKGDESQIARKFSEENSVRFIHKVLDETEFTNWIKDYLNVTKDVPAGDPNTALMFGISRIARENNYKVLLVGEGGDEIGGYPIYKKLDYLDKIMKHIPDFLSKWIVNFARFIPHNNLKKKIIRVFSVPTYANRFIFGFTEFEKRKFWKKRKKFDSYKALKDFADEIRDDLKDSYLRKVLNIEYKLRLAELLLPRVDYPSMAASIEARSPFMDHKLIEYSASLPWSIKMENGPKTILKKISENKLPEYIIKSPKVGFGQLLNPFFEETLPQWFERDIINDAESPIRDYIDYKFLYNLHKKHIKSKVYGFQIWIIFSLNLWMKKNQQLDD